MTLLDGGRKTWARLRSHVQAPSRGTGAAVAWPLQWHAQPLDPKVDLEDKAAVLAALQRR